MSQANMVDTASAALLALSIVLLFCWYNRESFRSLVKQGFTQGRGLAFKDGFTQGRGLNFKDGFDQGRGLDFRGKEGYLASVSPVRSDRTLTRNRGLKDLIDASKVQTAKNRNLNDLSTADYYNSRKSTNPNRGANQVVSDKWRSGASIHLNANQLKTEGMIDGDETEYTRDRLNMGSDIDSTLNEVNSDTYMLRMQEANQAASLTGMASKWTDTGADELAANCGGIAGDCGGYGTYSPTYATINT